MKVLVVYDNNGVVFNKINDAYIVPNGLQHMEVVVPDDKILVGVDVSVTPHQPIFEDVPKTETELLKEENEQLKQSLADLWEVVLLGGAE